MKIHRVSSEVQALFSSDYATHRLRLSWTLDLHAIGLCPSCSTTWVKALTKGPALLEDKGSLPSQSMQIFRTAVVFSSNWLARESAKSAALCGRQAGCCWQQIAQKHGVTRTHKPVPHTVKCDSGSRQSEPSAMVGREFRRPEWRMHVIAAQNALCLDVGLAQWTKIGRLPGTKTPSACLLALHNRLHRNTTLLKMILPFCLDHAKVAAPA